MIDILPALQETLLPIIRNVLIAITALFILMLAIYLVSIYLHRWQNRYIIGKTAQWQSIIKSLLHEVKSPNDFAIPRRERKYFRAILIAECTKQGPDGRNKIRELYRQFGFFYRDIRQLRSHIWWKKIQAIERLGALELIEAGEHVFPLLTDKRSEVRFSSLRMLVSTNSKKLAQTLPQIFANNSRWAYRYLVNELFRAEIPVENLKTFVSSSNRDLRKAAAILLGKEEHTEAIPLSQDLARDNVKDVRREAVRSLGRIKSVEAIPVLEDTANDNEPQVRSEVARALGELKDLNTLFLIERLADDANFEVRFQAFFALDRFGEPGENAIRKYKDKYPEITSEFLSKN